jgi:hypothetical protein
MTMMGEVSFKIDFLRGMTPIMTEQDLEAFTNACEHLRDNDFTLMDLYFLDKLYAKFNKPEGGESAIKVPET